MGGPNDAIRLLTEQVAALTARVYRLEQMARTAAAPEPGATPEIQSQAHPQPPEVTRLPAPQLNTDPTPRKPGSILTPLQQIGNLGRPGAADASLERTIGQYWLNRIGIVAMLIGVSYF